MVRFNYDMLCSVCNDEESAICFLPKLTVGIDESLFTRGENNTRRILPQQWGFWRYIPLSLRHLETLDVFMVIVSNKCYTPIQMNFFGYKT
jgi:hypothetical protein